MTKKTITKMAIGAGIGALTGTIAYKIIKDRRDIKATKKLLEEEDYITEESEDEMEKNSQLLTHEDMLSKRKYI